MTTGGEFAHLSDYELAARSCRVEAEVARLEAAELSGAGFRLVPVVGSPALFRGRGGCTYSPSRACHLMADDGKFGTSAHVAGKRSEPARGGLDTTV